MSSTAPKFEPAATLAPKQVPGIPNLKLNDGNEVPVLGFGFGSARYKADSTAPLDEATLRAGTLALETGFHHLDAAEMYGNEIEVGHIIKSSSIPRQNLYITTKHDAARPPTDIPTSFALSLQRLGLEYVDLYLLHDPFSTRSSPSALQSAWAAMEAILASGRARSIGVSNFLQSDLEILLETATVVPAVNQIEYHPYLQHKGLLDFHRQKGIVTAAYATLAGVTREGPLRDAGVYERLAGKYGVGVGEIGLRWAIDQGIITLTTSSNAERLKGYLQNIGTFKLTQEEIDEIKTVGLGKNVRLFWNKYVDADDWN